MKQLLSVTLLLFFAISTTFAQVAPKNSEATIEDYERYLDKRLEMNFRLNAMDAIQLTPEEINAFNPVFNNYMNAKDKLTNKKFKILEEYAEEMEGEEDWDDQTEETADMIEDYWETEIAEMELKKDYYDVLENKIPFQKAIDFFLYEETVENSVAYDLLMPALPTIGIFEKGKRKKRKKMKREVAMKQPKRVSDKDWERYIDKRLEMDFRLAAIKEMNLTSEEIKAFNPLFDQYMDARDKMTEKKLNLIDKYAEKFRKEDDEDDRMEEMSDFIEDYWEAEIASMKLREASFDRMENDIPYFKVAQFFFLEEALENRIKYDVMARSVPSIIIIEKARQEKRDKTASTDNAQKESDAKAGTAGMMTDADQSMKDKVDGTSTTDNQTKKDWNSNEGSTWEKNSTTSSNNGTMTTTNTTTPKVGMNRPTLPQAEALTTFDNWVKTTGGQMSLSHDYTSNGLKAVTNALEATVKATNTTINDWDSKKAQIMDAAYKITIDPKSTMHADWVSEAFITIGNITNTLNNSNKNTYAGGQVNKLQYWANSIDPDTLLMKQSYKVYGFFETANQAIQEIWNYAAKEEVATTKTNTSTGEE